MIVSNRLADYRESKPVTGRLMRILSTEVGKFLKEQGNTPGLRMSAARAMIGNAAVLMGLVCGRRDEEFIMGLKREMERVAKRYCKEHWDE